MKKLTAFLLAICLLLSVALLASCAADMGGSSYPGGFIGKGEAENGSSMGDGYFGSGDMSPTAPEGGDFGGGSSGEGMPVPPMEDGDMPDSDGGADDVAPDEEVDSEDGEKIENDQVTLPSGMITAGAWNDNDNYEMWLEMFSQDESAGKFYQYTMPSYSWGYNSLDRVKVAVTSGGAPVSGASVVATDDNGAALFNAVTDAKGIAYLFVNSESGKISVTSGNGTAEAEFSKDSREIAVDLAEKAEKLNVIEIMFVVDVTGSMGDEIYFLKAELADVINRIAENNTDTVIKLAFLFYRDQNDSVPFDYYDFTDVTTDAGLAAQQAALNKQGAKGGGDYPEAVDEALDMAVNAQWSTGATTKLIFHVLDAPAHNGAKYKEKLVNATKIAAEKGIRLCPIICSGAMGDTEYTMREAAIYTGGTFIFVTDDSGIGGSHHDPNLPNVTVELLNSLMVRLVNGYHTGSFADPVYWKEDQGLYK